MNIINHLKYLFNLFIIIINNIITLIDRYNYINILVFLQIKNFLFFTLNIINYLLNNIKTKADYYNKILLSLIKQKFKKN